MTLEEMQMRRRVLGYTYKDLADRSGVPLPTVQKIFGGATKTPREATRKALEAVLREGGAGSKGKKIRGAVSAIRDNRLSESPEFYGSFSSDSSAGDKAPAYPLLPHKRQGEYTAADREELPAENRTELIDGVLYDLAAPSNVHQVILQEVYAQLRECIRKNGRQCYAFMAPSDVWIDGNDRTVLQPDLYVICDYSMLSDRHRTVGAPVLVIEVISPSTKSRDFLLKAYKYSAAGVREYWLIDPEKEKITVFNYASDPSGSEREEYSFGDAVPIASAGGKCRIDFKAVKDVLDRLGFLPC